MAGAGLFGKPHWRQLAPTFGQLTFVGLFGGGVAAIIGVLFAIFSFLFVDMFDSIGVLVGVGIKAGFVNEKGELPGAGKALFVSGSRGCSRSCVRHPDRHGVWCREYHRYC